MWIWTANKFAKFHAKRLKQNENIPKSFRGLLISETPCSLDVSYNLILTRLDYCNSVMYGAPASSRFCRSAKQCSQDRSPGSKTISRPTITAWAALVLPIQHRIEYKVAVLTFKSRSSTQHRHTCQWMDTLLVCRPTTGQSVHQDRLRETSLSLFCANCLNSLPQTIISVDSLSVFKSRLNTYFFRKAFD